MTATETPADEQWAIVEVMGHRYHTGKISEHTIAGAGFLKVEALTVALADNSDQWQTFYYQPHAIFSIHPCSEERARSRAPKQYPAGPAGLALDPRRYPIDEHDDLDDDPVDEESF